MEHKNTKSNSFGSEQLAAKYNLFVTYAKKQLKGHFSYKAMDAANNAFEKALLNVNTFRGTESQLESWICAIVYNCCKDEQRDKRLWFSHDGDVTKHLKELSYEMTIHLDGYDFGKKLLWNAFETLSDREQKLITFRTFYKWPLDETAEALGIDKRYVSEYHRRALKNLKDKLGGRKF
jgi:RNA polymerase sigma factor (sigma-70 family)